MDNNLLNETIHKIESQELDQTHIDRIYKDICDIYYTELNNKVRFKYISKKNKKRYRHSPKEWWNDNLENLWKDLCASEKEYLKHEGPKRIKAAKRSAYLTKQRLFDRTVKKTKRLYIKQKHCEIEELQTNDPRKFWDHIKNLGPKSKKTIPMEVYDEYGNVTDDPQSVLSKWEHEFKTLLERIQTSEHSEFDETFYEQVLKFKQDLENHIQDSPEPTNNEDILNTPISVDEISKACSNSKNSKSPGIDKLPYEVYKNDRSIKLLHALFNRCFSTGMVPSVWKKAIIKPIPKNSASDPRVPLNYRGISLLNSSSKLFTMVLNTRLTVYLDANEIIVDEQNGFRKLRSCADHLFTLCSIIRNRKSKGLSTFSCFIDMTKAFDNVDIECMLSKLLANGISGNFYRIVKHLYTMPKSCVLVNNLQTKYFDVHCGVKQGDIISPTLFSLYVNDLVNELNSLNLGVPIDDENICALLYADDIVIFSDTEDNLQTLLDGVYKWCTQWRLRINLNKTNIVHFRKQSQNRTEFQFKIGENIIEIKETYKYLGCILSETFDFTVTATALAESAGRALGSLINKYRAADGLPFSVYTKLYHACVVPIMDYCASVWGFKSYPKCNTVHNRAIRVYLGVHNKSSNLAIKGDVGWIDPDVRRKLEMIRMWDRLVKMDDNRLTKRVFLWDYNQQHGWCSDRKKIFSSIGLNDLYETISVDGFSTRSLLTFAETKFKSEQCNKWNTDILKQPKLRTYIQIKNEYKCENYVSMNLSRSIRSYIAQIRCGVLPLHIETGRYRNLKVEERLCKVCDLKTVENELHFVFDCPTYSQLRLVYYNWIIKIYPDFLSLPQTEKLKVMLTDKRVIQKSGLFIQNCFLTRTSKLFVQTDS